MHARGHIALRLCPPSTGIVDPITHDARFEASHSTASATSSGLPNLPPGISFLTNSAIPSGSSTRRVPQEPPSNPIDPGAILLIRMPSDAQLRAYEFESAIWAAFDD